MTICISSVCTHNDKQIFVIATDHMIDVGIGQFEHDIKKHKKINGKNIAMLAGNALFFNELLANIKINESFSTIKNNIFDNFTKLKKDYIKKNLLDKFGLSENEIKDIVKGNIANNFIGKLIEQIAKFELKTGILLVGFENNDPQIAEINENGFADFSDIHFHAIGSGSMQAINTLLFQKQSACNSLKTTIYNVYKAKRNAEVSSGVGRETDMLILTDSGCYDLVEEDLNALSEIYDTELKVGKESPDLDKLKLFNEGKLKIKESNADSQKTKK